MFVDHIAEAWRRVMVGVASAKGRPRSVIAEYDADFLARKLGAEANDNAQPRPYSPERHSPRSDASLHLSC